MTSPVNASARQYLRFSTDMNPGPKRAMVYFLETLLGIGRLEQLYRNLPSRGPGPEIFLEKSLRALSIPTYNFDFKLAIPESGPLLIYGNHPFGGAEALVLSNLILKFRKDLKIMANPLLGKFSPLSSLLIATDPFGRKDGGNLPALRHTLNHLKFGGCLLIFPAGEVSHLRRPWGPVADPPWKRTVLWLARETGATLIPFWAHGSNPLWFHGVGLLHPRLRTALLPRALLHGAKKLGPIIFGKPFLAPTYRDRNSEFDVLTQLRLQCEELKIRQSGLVARVARCSPMRPGVDGLFTSPSGLWPRVSNSPLEKELASLPQAALLLNTDTWQVYAASSAAIPNTLLEIGKQRALAFGGHGNQKAVDLDCYDECYEHLFLWHRPSSKIAGGYRAGRVRDLLQNGGIQALYTSTLFDFAPEFFAHLPPAVELGRSFVQKDFQKHPLTLFYLWKGLARWVTRQKGVHVLFGPASIDNGYRDDSRSLMAGYCECHHGAWPFSQWVRPKEPWPPELGLHPGEAGAAFQSLAALGAAISQAEHDGRGVPALLRHYLSLGGRLAGFHLDQSFSNSLDGLLMLDLLEADARVMGRTLGTDLYKTWKKGFLMGGEPRKLFFNPTV